MIHHYGCLRASVTRVLRAHRMLAREYIEMRAAAKPQQGFRQRHARICRLDIELYGLNRSENAEHRDQTSRGTPKPHRMRAARCGAWRIRERCGPERRLADFE